ncbi:MAG: hypothetical protein ACK4LB_13600 [Spirosomataceae bacterium]
MKKWIWTLGFVLLLGLMESQAQCAMCRATVGSNLSEGRGVIGTGINFGILYLLSAPYLLVLAVGILWYRTGKKELKERLQMQARLHEIFKK